jgi:5'-nucleotidase
LQKCRLSANPRYTVLRVYHSRLDERTDPRGKPYYWIGGDAPTGVPERGTDVGALAEGFVSVTPLQLDLTAYRAITDLNTWHWDEPPYEKRRCSNPPES